MSSHLEAALELAQNGYRVIPAHGWENGMCSCGNPDCSAPGKRPLTLHGCKDGTTNAEQIREWFGRWPTANVAVCTGQGLLVLDRDGQEGAQSLAELEMQYGPLPRTLHVQTGRGEQFYFKTGEPLGNSTAFRPGLDTRGEGGYAIAPPSMHRVGKRYEFIDCDAGTPLAPAPAWLIDLLKKPSRSTKGIPTANGPVTDQPSAEPPTSRVQLIARAYAYAGSNCSANPAW